MAKANDEVSLKCSAKDRKASTHTVNFEGPTTGLSEVLRWVQDAITKGVSKSAMIIFFMLVFLLSTTVRSGLLGHISLSNFKAARKAILDWVNFVFSTYQAIISV